MSALHESPTKSTIMCDDDLFMFNTPPLPKSDIARLIDVSRIEEVKLARYFFGVWFTISLHHQETGLVQRFSEVPDMKEIRECLEKRFMSYLGDIPAKIFIHVDEEAGTRLMDVSELLRWGGITFEEMQADIAELPRL